MATQVQIRRGTTAQHSSFTGASAELTFDTDLKTVRAHDGTTAGGIVLAKASDVSTAVANLINSAPATLDTLNEIALALNSDNNFAVTIVTQLGTKANTTSLTTANVVEVSNLYFTDIRARQAISATGSLNYSNTTGILSFTQGNTDTITEGSTNLYYTNARVYSNVISIGYATNANVNLKANLTDKLSVFAATTSAELAGVISDETGSGSLVFATNPVLLTPNIGTPSYAVLTNATGLPLSSGVTGTLPVANGGTGVTGSTGTGSVVLSAAPTFTGTISAANLTLSGDLTVNGTTTTINSTTISVDDKNIELGSVASPTDITADGGGITLKGATDKTFNWVSSTNAWTSSEDLNLLTGKVFEINGTQVLSSSGLGSGILASNLTSLGTISSGTWQGSEISTTYTAAKVTSVNGQTGAATGFATTANSLSQFASTTSAQLATLISDETGTGSLVFNASPTFTGTVSAAEINATGNVTSPFFYSQSDINLKKDLVHVTNALDIVKLLDGYWFKWKNNDADSIGLIAQHVEAVLPMLIGTSPDGSKTVLYNGIIAILLEAVKAQQVQIDEIKSKLNG